MAAKMFKKSALLILAAFIWIGLSVEKTPEGGFDVSFAHADAKKDKSKSKGNKGGNKSKSKGNKGGNKSKGNSKSDKGGGKGSSGGSKSKGSSKSDKGSSKGKNGGSKSKGNNKSKDSKKSDRAANKAAKQEARAEKKAARLERKAVNKAKREKKHAVAKELKDLISLNRDIKNVLDSSKPALNPFRDLFYEDSGKPKQFAKDAELKELVDDYDLLMMLDKHYGHEVNDYVFRDVRYMLRQRFEEYKALR